MSLNETLMCILPVFNNEASLPELTRRLDILRSKLEQYYELKLSVILIDDGSSDGSWSVIEKLADKYSFVEGLALVRNVGQHNAIWLGLNEAKGAEFICVLDADLQHRPDDIHTLVQKLLNSRSAYCVAESGDRRHPFFKKLITNFYYSVARAVGMHQQLASKQMFYMNFVVMRKVVVEYLLQIKFSGKQLLPLLFDTHFSRIDVQVEHCARPFDDKKTSYSLAKLLAIGTYNLVGNLNLVISLFFILGVCVATGALVFGIWAIIFYFTGSTLAGWTSLAVLLSTIIATNFFGFSVVLLVLSKLFTEITQYPIALVHRDTRNK